ncbi:MAG: hypothetical protein HY835_05685 [Anaerolineae bacterium]|nr:hypothetical protein [Anaerolineae bacterium]
MGGGSLWDVGVYPLSFSQAIFNAPLESVFAWGKEGNQSVEMSCAALCRYSNGRTASFFSSFETPFSTAMTIFGDQGRLEIDHPFTHLEGASTFRLYSKEGKLTLLPFDQRELYLCEAEGMEDAILNGIPNPVTLLDTRNHIRTVLAIDESMRSGIPVTL